MRTVGQRWRPTVNRAATTGRPKARSAVGRPVGGSGGGRPSRKGGSRRYRHMQLQAFGVKAKDHDGILLRGQRRTFLGGNDTEGWFPLWPSSMSVRSSGRHGNA